MKYHFQPYTYEYIYLLANVALGRERSDISTLRTPK